MGRLEGVLGRSPLDRPAAAPGETVELWVDEDPHGSLAAAASGDKGPDAPRRPSGPI